MWREEVAGAVYKDRVESRRQPPATDAEAVRGVREGSLQAGPLDSDLIDGLHRHRPADAVVERSLITLTPPGRKATTNCRHHKASQSHGHLQRRMRDRVSMKFPGLIPWRVAFEGSTRRGPEGGRRGDSEGRTM